MKWEDCPGWFDWEEYYREVVEKYPGGTLVEVGCYLGRSLCCLGTLVKKMNRPFKVVGVEWGLGSGVENGLDNHLEAIKRNGRTLAGELCNNVVACGLQDIVTVVVGESGRVSELFAPDSIQMVFLDAGHDYQSVCRDIELWGPKVKLGGELAGDDVGVPGEVAPVWPGVRDAVNKCLPGWRHVPHDAWAWTKK